MAEDRAKVAQGDVDFTVNQRNSNFSRVRAETKDNQQVATESVGPTTEMATGSPPFASIKNPFVQKKQEQFCTVGEDIPVFPRSSN